MKELKPVRVLNKDLQKVTLAIVTKCVFNIPDKNTALSLSLRYFSRRLEYDERVMPNNSDYLRNLRKLKKETKRGEFKNVITHFEKLYKAKNPDWCDPEDTVERGIGIAFRNLALGLT